MKCLSSEGEGAGRAGCAAGEKILAQERLGKQNLLRFRGITGRSVFDLLHDSYDTRAQSMARLCTKMSKIKSEADLERRIWARSATAATMEEALAAAMADLQVAGPTADGAPALKNSQRSLQPEPLRLVESR